MRSQIIKVLSALMLMLASATSIYASKAMCAPFTVVLADGRQVTVSLRGDEHFSCYVTQQGELVVKDGDVWRVATEAEQNQTKENLQKARRKANEKIYGSIPFPSKGTPRALVILADFTDKPLTYTKDDFEKWFNGTECNDPNDSFNSYSSMAQYFDDCSDGQYRPQFDIVGPYHLPNTVRYYGTNGGGNSDANHVQFLKDACALADADVDFSQYDANGDGYIDLVYLIYAGYGENMSGEPDQMWAKSGTNTFGTYDGKKAYRYAINNELLGYDGALPKPHISGIGVAVHEMCHTLGLPDFYPTVTWNDVTKYDNQSMEFWDLMDAGENVNNGCDPMPLSAFERELLGWITIEDLVEPANVEMKPLMDGGKAYRIRNGNDATNNEYYILEAMPNGAGTGWYRRQFGNGLLITHVNYSVELFSNFRQPNNEQGKPRITIVPADGVLYSSYRWATKYEGTSLHMTYAQIKEDHAGDTYPGTKNVTEFTNYKAYIGTIDKPITDIEQNGMNISFKFMGGAQTTIASNLADDLSSSRDIYNIYGQKVGADYKGIIIKGGKKTVQ